MESMGNKYEYQVMLIPKEIKNSYRLFEEWLNDYGEHGWQLVYISTTEQMIIFKREIE